MSDAAANIIVLVVVGIGLLVIMAFSSRAIE